MRLSKMSRIEDESVGWVFIPWRHYLLAVNTFKSEQLNFFDQFENICSYVHAADLGSWEFSKRNTWIEVRPEQIRSKILPEDEF
jgi:hypothetical protein